MPDESKGYSSHRGAGEPGTPGKGSEVPLNSDRGLKPGETADTSGSQATKRPRAESPGGAADMKRIE
jgi:hypothetical protein